VLVAIMSLAAVALTTAYAVRRPGRWAWLPLLGSSAWWLVANKPLEGPILWVADPERGLTAADLVVPAALALAVLAAWRVSQR
jgi:hypothetical protein